MSAHEFDAHADSYRKTLDNALAISRGDGFYCAERKFAALRSFMAERSRATPTAILDFGCGAGTNLSFLREIFADPALYGEDVSSRSLELARERHIPGCQLTSYDGTSLPFDGAKFDVVVSNLLHQVEPPHRAATLREISHCMKPGGLFGCARAQPYQPCYTQAGPRLSIRHGCETGQAARDQGACA